jgi:hypothetical protein
MNSDNIDSDDDIIEWPPEFYEKHWQNMPSYDQPKNSAYRQLIINFENEDAVKAFSDLVGQNLTKKTKSIWFPKREQNNVSDLFWIEE